MSITHEDELVSLFAAKDGKIVYAVEQGVSKQAVKENLAKDSDFPAFKENNIPHSVLSFEFDVVYSKSQVEQPSALHDNQAFIFFGPSNKAKKNCILQNTPLLDAILAQKLQFTSTVYVQIYLIHINDVIDLLDPVASRTLLKRTAAGFEV